MGLLRRFALNTLLLPLIDGARLPHRTLAAPDLSCSPSARVLVDGGPRRQGAPLPRTPFRLQGATGGQQDGGHAPGVDAVSRDGSRRCIAAPDPG